MIGGLLLKYQFIIIIKQNTARTDEKKMRIVQVEPWEKIERELAAIQLQVNYR